MNGRSVAQQECLSSLVHYPIAENLARQLPESFARERRAVLLQRQGDQLIVAMADPSDVDTLSRIRAMMACELLPVLARETDIEIALERVYSFHETPELWPVLLRVSLSAGFLTPHQLSAVEHELQLHPDEQLAVNGRQTILPEDDFAEALGLALHIPRLRLDNYLIAASLARIIPHAMAQQNNFVTLLPANGHLVVASPAPIAGRILRKIQEESGYEPIPVLCSWGELIRGLERGYGAKTNGQIQPALPLWQQLVKDGTISKDLLDKALVIEQQTGQPLEQIVVRLGSIGETQLLEARARMYRLKLLVPERTQIDTSLALAIPEPVARRYRCLPLQRMPRWIQVAVVDPSDKATLEMLELLLESPIQPVLAAESWLETAFNTLYSTPQPSTGNLRMLLGDYLVRGGLLSRAQLAEALHQQQKTGKRLGECLIQMGVLGEGALAEVLALQAALPWVNPSRYEVPVETLHLLPKELAEEHGILPLYRDGQTLIVATSEPGNQTGLQLAREISGLPLLVVLAGHGAIQEAVERLYTAGHTAIGANLRAFGDRLVRRGILSREQLLKSWAQHGKTGVPFDAAATSLGFLTGEQFAKAVAEELKLPLVDLSYRLVPIEFIDGLGSRRDTFQWTEPVDPLVARMLPEASAQRHLVIPFRRSGETIFVALVTPLEETALSQIEEELGHSISYQVATRAQVEEAIRRAHDRRTLGDLLVESDLISRKQLDEGLALHHRTGVRIGKVLVSLGHVTQDQLVTHLSEQMRLPYFSLSGVEIPEEIARTVPETLARGYGLLPLDRREDVITLAMTNPMDADAIREVEQITGCKVQPVLTTGDDLEMALERIYRSDYLWTSANDLVFRYPDESASRVLILRQKLGLLAFLGISAVLLYLNAIGYLTVLVAFSTLFYVTFSAYKFYLIYKALSHSLEVDVSEEEIAALDDRDLPIYTVLVPLYREAEVLPTLVRAIDALDYPKTKLDVKLLLEEDDEETIEAVHRQQLPAHFKPVIVPNAQPKGKPKACNYGLIHAEGDYVVIYDAEDIPDSDQLKRALLAFRKAGESVSCIQAKLNYYNRDQNLLTRWFTTEYSTWFDLFIPGLDASNAPIPLGGTSNHFRTSQLREMGAWDPYNVTEDADLGVRLFKAGGKTAVIDSTTYEEANSEIYNWIRQRSRWVKGYIQTYLVHMRHPLKLIREIGLYQFISFNLVIGGTFFGFLVNPIFWLLTTLWFLTHWGFIQQLFPAPIFYVGSIGLYLGNFAFMYTNVAGCMRRGYYDMVKYALISPIYWALMSVGAWKGFLQLFYRPSYWEKTKHGLYRAEPRTQPGAWN